MYSPSVHGAGSARGPGPDAVRAAALIGWEQGLQVYPAKQDGSKMPDAKTWKSLQVYRLKRDEVEQLFARQRTGLGIFTGQVSGGVVLFEFDDRQTYERFKASAGSLELGDLVDRIEDGYCEDTPSGGVHWLIRVELVGRNRKLASRPKLPDEMLHPKDKTKVLIETREGGGWVVLAPSHGGVHDSGRPYRLRAGGFGTIASLTTDEQLQLWALAETFDEMPDDERFRLTARQKGTSDTSFSAKTGDRPGDRFAAETDWLDILPAGWQVVGRNAENLLLRRPGKSRGWSATISQGGHGVLYVFTSSAAPFDGGQSYTKFGAYTLLEHGGDWKAATKALAERYATPSASRRGNLQLVGHDDGAGVPPGDGAPAEPDPAKRTPRTDLGNAERLVKRHGEDLRYCHPWGAWMVWDGRRWKRDDTAEVVRRAKDTVRSIYAEAAAVLDDTERAALAGWAKTSESSQRIDAMAKLARAELSVPILPNEMDADPYLLNVLNGTIDLRTGDLRPHDRTNAITKLAPAEYDPAAECPAFLAFLAEIQPDPAVREFLRRMAGYGLTGVTVEQCLFFLHGGGANGKSTFLNAIQQMLGDYAKEAAPELLTTHGGDRHPTELADLFGARFVTSSEIDDGKRLAEALVKQMTGGDTIKARFMRTDFFQWVPTHKLFLAANHRPIIRGTDHAIWRRIHLIPFEIKIPEERRDRDLGVKLARERSGILRWAVEGCLAWLKSGLQIPDVVRAATEIYRAEQDTIGVFLADHCIFDEQATVQATPLFKSYSAWCEQAGEKPMTQQAFGRRLTERGYVADREKSGSRPRIWIGLRFALEGEKISEVRPVPAGSGRLFPYENNESPIKETIQEKVSNPAGTGRTTAWRCPKCRGMERTLRDDLSWRCDGCGTTGSDLCQSSRSAPAEVGARCSSCEGRGT